MKLARNAAGLAFALVVVGGIGVAWIGVGAQGLGAGSAGSLAELTGEVRQLRVAIVELGRSQSEMQAASAWLSAEQSRLALLNARLDVADAALEKAAEKTREQAAIHANYEAQVARGSANLTAEERNRVSEVLRDGKAIVDRAQEEENALRNRQQDLLAQIRGEEARWMDQVARLEGIIKR